jgi:hypothetical protein
VRLLVDPDGLLAEPEYDLGVLTQWDCADGIFAGYSADPQCGRRSPPRA